MKPRLTIRIAFAFALALSLGDMGLVAAAETSSSVTPSPAGGAVAVAVPKVSHWDLARVRSEMKLKRGHPFLIHLWASWCGPCLEELPNIDAFARKARARGIAVVSMSLDATPDSDERVLATLHQRAPSLTPVVADFDDPATFGALFSRTWEGSIPALFAFDARGTLRRSVLELAEPAELDALLESLLRDDGANPRRGRSPRAPKVRHL